MMIMMMMILMYQLNFWRNGNKETQAKSNKYVTTGSFNTFL